MGMAQGILIVCLVLTMLVTAIDPALAAGKKKKSKTDMEAEKGLEPFAQELTTLSQKGASRGLFSPAEMAKAMEIKLQLLDLMQQYPGSPVLAKPAYEAGRLFRSRELYDDAYDFFNFLQSSFPTSPYASQARVEIQRMKQLLGDSYFADSGSAAPAQPLTP